MKNALNRLFKGGTLRGDAARIYVYQFITLGMGLIGGVIVARTLGPANKGILDIFKLINSFIVELGFLGFGSGLLYYLANKRQPLNEIHGTGLLFSLIIGLLTAIVGLLGLPFWKMIFPGLSSWYILLAFLISPISYYLLSWSNIMTGINQAVATYKIGLFLSILSLLLILALGNFGSLNAQYMIGLTVILSLISAMIGFQILYREAPDVKANTSLMTQSLRYGSIVYMGNIANILHFKIDQIMINYWLGTRAVGIYAVSVNWAEMLFILDGAIVSAALYKISSSSPEDSYELTKKLFKVQLLISGGSGIIFAALAYPLVVLLYGDAYRESVWPLVLLIPGIIAWSVSKIISGFLSYNAAQASYVTKVAIAGALLNIILNYLLIVIISFGIKGASIASSISYLTVTLLIIYKAKLTDRSMNHG